MNKCIVCECASVLYYQPPKERPPIKCPNCGRDTRHYISMRADDPRVNTLVVKYGGSPAQAPREEGAQGQDGQQESEIRQHSLEGRKRYCLVSADGSLKIHIPEDGGIIGRTAIGGEELAHNGRVSREHVKVMPAKRAEGIMLQDISANGTFIDGRRLMPHKQEFAVVGSRVRLAGEEFILEVCDES